VASWHRPVRGSRCPAPLLSSFGGLVKQPDTSQAAARTLIINLMKGSWHLRAWIAQFRRALQILGQNGLARRRAVPRENGAIRRQASSPHPSMCQAARRATLLMRSAWNPQPIAFRLRNSQFSPPIWLCAPHTEIPTDPAHSSPTYPATFRYEEEKRVYRTTTASFRCPGS
jgi:hypothetical protein